MRMVATCGFNLLFQFLFIHAQETPTPQDKTAGAASTVPRLTVKGEVMKKHLLHKVYPNYPPEARRKRIQGTVKLRVLVGVDGSVKETALISGEEMLVKPTIDAVRKWKYVPPTASGQPVEVDTTVDVVFSVSD